MRKLRILFLAILGIVLFTLALANRDSVTLRLLPDDAAAMLRLPNQFTTPLFVVILAALVAGILVGLVWEWFREYQFRAEAARKRREAAALKRDLDMVKPAKTGGQGDEIIAILDNSG